MFVILDRDGVINFESPEFIKNPDEWIPIPGSLQAIANLKANGYKVVVATNQSGIARGLYSHEMLNHIHEKMLMQLKQLNTSLDGIFYCPHHPNDHCSCRKPQPGLLLQIAQQFKIDLQQTVCVGDSLRDIQAAQFVRAKPLLVLTGNGQKTATMQGMSGVEVFADLAAVTQHLLHTRSDDI